MTPKHKPAGQTILRPNTQPDSGQTICPVPLQSNRVAEVIGLLDRARGDLGRGWIEAALDCLGRARRILEALP